MSTPDLHLETAYVLDDAGRIVSSREPGTPAGPLFVIVRSATSCAWAVRADVPNDIAGEFERLAREEPPVSALRDAPLHSDQYLSLVPKALRFSGPCFTFPELLPQPTDVVVVDDERLLERNFGGWAAGEIAAGRSPVLAIIEDGFPVSVCFCARRSDAAAEAGLETAAAFQGRGFGPRVTAAWALALRATGREPLYSTSWENAGSLAVARKLGLVTYASTWSLTD